jgi:hypothetical protein
MPTRRTTESARTADSAPATEKVTPRRRAAAKSDAAVALSESARRAMVEQAAYLRAERRGFAPGGELEDWLAAEVEVDALLRAGNGRMPQ